MTKKSFFDDDSLSLCKTGSGYRIFSDYQFFNRKGLDCDVTISYFAHFSRDFALLLPDIEKNMFLNYAKKLMQRKCIN